MNMSGYLRSLAVGDAELARTAARFDTAVQVLGAILAQPIAIAFRLQLADDIAGVWISQARATLGRLDVRPPPDSASPEQREARALMRKLAQGLASDGDDDHLREEAARCGRELAQRALSRWFHLLELENTDSADGVILNANLLPQTGELNDIAVRVEAQSYGIEPVVVSGALRTYWDQLFDTFVEMRKPVELGPHLWIVPETIEEPRSYRLFRSESHAGAFAASLHPLPLRAMSTHQLIRFALARIHYTDDTTSVAALVEAMQNLLSQCGTPEEWIDYCEPFQESPKRSAYSVRSLRQAFEESVEFGVDSVLSVSALSEAEAVKQLQSSDKDVRDRLWKYAKSNKISFKAVSSAYAGGVAYTILSKNDSEAVAHKTPPDIIVAGMQGLCDSFMGLLDLGRKPARELASTTVVGMGRLMHPAAGVHPAVMQKERAYTFGRLAAS